ncbi:MAG: succinate dehydrogenase, hydrophobic membrane anchor protein [Burkholderiaceae bacterium]|nr:succinate dehydrogenase, hydrophobic membrane anchor protein [Sulfuritalea sp.]MCF8173955.1 succinate dehydrogenase, hydrophobic membrane anchor protein [Burkholderiaceae bacterium]MCF8185089.1 succinate dehydrogenase, hydrophobic membrane anchor protein [Polynucleobacter sp.]
MKRLVVGAHYGLMDWLAQRVTGVLMAIYTVIIFAAMLGGATASREAWQAFMANGFIRFITFLFIISLCYHAWVGVRDIWMDYVNPAAMRVILHVLTLLALVGYAGWAVQIIWRL